MDKLQSQLIYESTTDGTIESLLSTITVAYQLGVFTDTLFNDMKFTFTQTISNVLRSEIKKIPKDAHSEYLKYANALKSPIESATDMKSFIKALSMVVAAKKNIIKRLSIPENHIQENISSTLNSLKSSIKKLGDDASEWVISNKKKIIGLVVSILTTYIISFLDYIFSSK